MDANDPEMSDRHFISATLKSHWLLFALVGALLLIAGAIAIVVPAISSIEPNELLALVLAVVGIVQIVQCGKMQGNFLFAWHLTLGLAAAIGGVLVYIEPFPGILTKTVVMAIVFAVHGATQIAFAVRVRQIDGWHWFLVSGAVALIVAALLIAKLPYGHTFTPATVGGVSLLFSGWAYLAVALAARRS